MKNIKDVFEGLKKTENGDDSYSTTGDQLLDLLFMSTYFTEHLDEVRIGNDEKSKMFSMLVRDPRFGLGCRALGRKLMELSGVSIENIIKAGRYDDLLYTGEITDEKLSFLKSEIEKGNELAKKWMPRFSSSESKKMLAKKISKRWGMNKREYNKFVKVKTTESLLTERNTDEINFSHVPSVASMKYANRFSRGEDTQERYEEWKENVKKGKSKVNVSVSCCYDIYKRMNDDGFDSDMFFDKLKKINISCLPIVDTSGSMCDTNDSIGKALSIGHYLAKCSTYMKDTVLSFSSQPQLLSLEHDNEINCGSRHFVQDVEGCKSNYCKEINRMVTGDCSNTDFGKVMEIMKQVDCFPDYLIVLSDQEFDCGSRNSTLELEKLWKENNCNTKIIWWNFNSRNKTAIEKQSNGNIFMSGWNPTLLKFLQLGFDGKVFLDTLIDEYSKKIK